MTRPKHRIYVEREPEGHLATLLALAASIAGRQRLSITYHGVVHRPSEEDGLLDGIAEPTSRIIEPLAFYRRRRGHYDLYLLAWCHLRNAARSFVPSRIGSWAVAGSATADPTARKRELQKFGDSFDQIVELELIEGGLEKLAELEPAADALRVGDIEAALEVLVAVRPDELANFAAAHVHTARSTRSDELARYIWRFLRKRNRAQLMPALAAMNVRDVSLALDELALIITHNGHPPNWVPEEEPEEEDDGSAGLRRARSPLACRACGHAQANHVQLHPAGQVAACVVGGCSCPAYQWGLGSDPQYPETEARAINIVGVSVPVQDDL